MITKLIKMASFYVFRFLFLLLCVCWSLGIRSSESFYFFSQ